MKPIQRSFGFWLVLGLLGLIVVNLLHTPQRSSLHIEFSEFIKGMESGFVERVVFSTEGNEITGKFVPTYRGGETFETVGDTGPETFKICKEHGVIPDFKRGGGGTFWQQILFSWGPMLFVFFLLFFMLRNLQGGSGKAMNFGKARAKLLTENNARVTFEDVAGAEEAKQELLEIVEFLRNPKRFTRLGGRIPKGVLLLGPPGTGKTLLARAVAGEAGVPFFSISGSDFVEMFVGVGASRVRDLFDQAKQQAPCIVFIDEIDALGRQRGTGIGGGHDEREQTLNQLLVELDGFETNEGVILIAATNRPDVLDPALLRPGRFDRRVQVAPPDFQGRLGILKIHTRRTPMAQDVNLDIIAAGTPGFTGADLESLVNEAALSAARANRPSVTLRDLDDAKDKVLMGAERKSLIVGDEQRRCTAYHEAGHALVGRLIPGTDPIHKITIIPRGRALGVTQTLPLDDRLTLSKEFVENNISFLMGGRAAEAEVFHHLTTGAGNDLQRATELARRMVCEWGMSDKIGPLTFGNFEEYPFMGRDMMMSKPYSEATAKEIDGEITRIVQSCYDRASKLVRENIEVLHRVARALLQHEVISGEQLDDLIAGRPIIVPSSGSPTVQPVMASDQSKEPQSKPIVGKKKPVTA